jgi:pimeloyl-ACP methyl ester carboxylesterase
MTFKSDRIAIETTGTGSDVILLAGSGASARQVWQGTIERVPGHRYHVVQVAGFAGSPSGANAAEGPVVQPIAEELNRYVREQRLDHPAVVGLSMGAAVAMTLAARHPESVGRVMVVDMIPFMGAFFGRPGQVATSEQARPIAEGVGAAMLAGRPGNASEEHGRASVAKMVRTESLRPVVLENGMASDPRVMTNVMREMIVLDLRPELAHTTVPIRVLYVHAPLISLDAEQTDAVYHAMYSGVPTASLRRVDNAYHFIMLDQPTCSPTSCARLYAEVRYTRVAASARSGARRSQRALITDLGVVQAALLRRRTRELPSG